MIDTLLNIAVEFWNVLGEMAPYLLFGFLMAGLLSVLISPEVVERHLGGRKFWPVLKSTLFGIPLPLCSCGVIPVGASLRRSGASKGATTAFLLSTPQTGVDSILVTYSLLGPVFAIFRPLVALASGLIGGLAVSRIDSKDDAAAGKTSVDECGDGCHIDDQDESRGKLYNVLHYGFVSLPQDIGKALLVGLVFAGLIAVIIPDDFFAGLLGGGIVAMFVMMLVGMPIYVCATASVPIAAALIAKGISPGAALVFLMTGPATNAATITTIWKILGKKSTIIYLTTVAVTALASGLTLDYIFTSTGISAEMGAHWMMPVYAKNVSAVVLLAVLGFALYKIYGRGATIITDEETEGQTAILSISGMTCNHCVASVERALREGAGVKSVAVDLKSGKAKIAGEGFDVSSLSKKVEELGYEVTDDTGL